MATLQEGFNSFTPLSALELDTIKNDIYKAYCVIGGQLKIYNSSLATNFSLTQIPQNTPAIIRTKNELELLGVDGSVGEVQSGSSGVIDSLFFNSVTSVSFVISSFLYTELLAFIGTHDTSTDPNYFCLPIEANILLCRQPDFVLGIDHNNDDADTILFGLNKLLVGDGNGNYLKIQIFEPVEGVNSLIIVEEIALEQAQFFLGATL